MDSKVSRLVCIELLQITPPFLVPIKLDVVCLFRLTQATLHGNKELVLISPIRFPAAAEVLIRQFRVAAVFFDVDLS